MINNAKQYNDKRSMVYEDADRIRKAVSNWMVRFNPAYKDPSYNAQATPMSDHTMNGHVANSYTPMPASRRAAQQVQEQTPQRDTPAARERSEVAGGSSIAPEGEDGDYAGKTFQQAQEQVLSELIKYRDPE